MTNNEEITFDEKSGISVEEQREILAQINGIADKNRISLAQGQPAGKKQPFKAKKSGGRFPTLVNAAALLLLAGGIFLLSSFQGKNEAQVREGARIYTSAERALIDEIRRETATRIALKEKEIAQVSSQLEGIGEELRALYSSKEELTADQRAAEARLLSLQSEYSTNFAALQDERSQILEDSRASESSLRAQLESRTSELASDREELSAAREQLGRLSGDMEKAAAIESQLGGGLAAVYDLIRDDRLNEAAEALRNLRLFLNTPAFRNIRSIQARREFYSQAINSFEVLVDDAIKMQAAGIAPPVPVSAPPANDAAEKELADLQLKTTQLEETITDLNKTIAALSSGTSGQAQRLTELEASLSSLRAANTAREQSISALQTDVANKNREIAGLQANAAEKDTAMAALQSIAAERDRTVSTLQGDNTRLTQTVSTRDSTIREMETRTSAQAGEITNLSSQLNHIRQTLQPLVSQELLNQLFQ